MSSFIPRIYFSAPLVLQETFPVDQHTAHYLSHVLRLSHHDRVILFTGQGGEYEARVYFEKKRVFFIPERYHAVSRSSSCHIHLGQALIRGDRMDYVIQKATELGVMQIAPLFTHHSVVKLDEARSHKRLQHWQNIGISASEQSGRTDLPTIHPPQRLAEWANQPFSGLSLLLDPDAEHTLDSLPTHTAFRCAIGPESGWDASEIALLKGANFMPCRLGPRILRTETAGIVIISILQYLFGDLRK